MTARHKATYPQGRLARPRFATPSAAGGGRFSRSGAVPIPGQDKPVDTVSVPLTGNYFPDGPARAAVRSATKAVYASSRP
jgi:hypothetical protein